MIYLNDSYIKEFHAPIVAVEEEKIITADSCFYAQSGGQPGDKGVVEVNGQKVNVINTIKHEKGIAHVLENVIESASGNIQGCIDWDHRFRLMRCIRRCTYYVQLFLIMSRRFDWFGEKSN